MENVPFYRIKKSCNFKDALLPMLILSSVIIFLSLMIYNFKVRQQDFNLMFNEFEIAAVDFSDRVKKNPEASVFSSEILGSQLRNYEFQYLFNDVSIELIRDVSSNNINVSYGMSEVNIYKSSVMNNECKSCHDDHSAYKLEAKYNTKYPSIIFALLSSLVFFLTFKCMILKNSICSLSLCYKRDSFKKSMISKDVKVLALIDIDFFKKINDTLGHAEGDRAINLLGQLLSSSTRNKDVVFRWGGEEFRFCRKL